MKKIAVIIMAVVFACMTLVSCGGGDYVGKWELQEMSGSGMTLTDNFMGIPIAVMLQLEFKADGTGQMFQNEDGDDEEDTSFNWEEKDGGIVLTKKGEDEELKFTLDGDMLVWDYSEDGQSVTYKLKKVDEFTTFDASQFDLGGLGN